MNAIGSIALVLFMVCWVVAAASWFYGFYHFIVSWLPWRDSESRNRNRRKYHVALALFVGCAALGAASGVIGGVFGNWPIHQQHEGSRWRF
ncbi:MAG TPA: hypothetical protein VE914_17700 [Candidatus Angelobacter sp.]|nr:hypothetical protein [Candidatus Angelobacter sp.]